MTLQCGQRALSLDSPQIMGVLNVTPDSFSDGGALYSSGQLDLSKTLVAVEAMLEAGADIIDIGGESTRPGAEPVTCAQELERVMPIVEAVISRFDTIVSVDTSTAQVIDQVAAAGAHLINDVRALQREGALAAAAASGLPVCLMHMQNQPDSMQNNPQYQGVVTEVNDFLQQRKQACVEAGISADQILLDPGFGFGKTLQHNLQLLKRLDRLQELQVPILVGISRKSMIGTLLNKPVDERLYGSLAAAAVALGKGAWILRVHDVAATQDVMAICQAVVEAE